MANAATTAGAVKQLIEGAGMSLAAYRDRAPDKATLPYCVVLEGLTLVPDPLETLDGMYRTGVETVQVDLWQQWRDPTSRTVTENYTLAPALTRLLEGNTLPTAPQVVYGMVVTSSIRMTELDNNLTHHALTVKVYRQL